MLGTLTSAALGEAQRPRLQPARQTVANRHGLMALQQSAGNRAVAALVQRAAVTIQREDDDGRVSLVKREVASIRAGFAAAPTASLSINDARELDAKLAQLGSKQGFERVRPLGLTTNLDASMAALAPPIPLTWPLIVETLEAIAAGIAALTLWEVLLIIALILAILLLLRKAFEDPVVVPAPPETPVVPDPKGEPKPDPEGRPRPGPGPVDPIPDSPRTCSPTGLSKQDAIPMTWFKPIVDDYYPRRLHIRGHDYDRDGQDHLPHGEPIGVSKAFFPSPGKPMQLLPSARGPGADDFRAVLIGYGFDWSGLQADHVQDLEFEGEDVFANLWPMDESANMSAGARTNQQVIGVCLTGTGPYVMYTLQQLKAAGLYGRYFEIRNITR
ncbi:hypothetical protein ACPPVT_00060 [Angustibacter sp. McL0619]|uniref:hypothetical protein n=1 Tax=Angustibacter sp. McL0619 TaxID=3415676 RepID=UPI003CE9E1D1